MDLDEIGPAATTVAPEVVIQALREVDRLVTQAVEQHQQGELLAASSSLIALNGVIGPLISQLRHGWLCAAGVDVGVSEADDVNDGLYL